MKLKQNAETAIVFASFHQNLFQKFAEIDEFLVYHGSCKISVGKIKEITLQYGTVPVMATGGLNYTEILGE